MPKIKQTKSQRIKQLENQVSDLQKMVEGFMSFVGYEGTDYVSVLEKATIKTVNINISK